MLLSMQAATPIRNGSPRFRALRALREHLAHGVWAAGERLPAEERLASALGVSRPTVRAALATLEAEGLIRSLGRAGRVVAGEPVPAAPAVMASTVVVLSHVCHEAPPGYHGGSNEAVDSGIQDEAQSRGLNLLRIHPGRLSPPTPRWLLENRPAAILVTPEMACCKEALALAGHLAEDGVPVVAADRVDHPAGCDLVLFDHAGGAAALTRWLAGQGCRRILPFWSTTRSLGWLADRRDGYERAMREAGLVPLEPVRCDFPPRPAERDEAVLEQRTRLCLGYLFEHLLGPARVDAVMLLEDSSVYPFLAACRLAGVKTGPGGILFTGFDNFWSECWERELFPLAGLATVDKQNYLAGQEMVRLAMERRDGSAGVRTPRRLVVPCVLRLPARADGGIRQGDIA